MKKVKFQRKGNQIKDMSTGQVKKFASINEAKKESRKLQIAEDGQIGRGSMKVVDLLYVG